THRASDGPDRTRVDEMALTSDGELLLAVNNASTPPFATLFTANGDSHSSSVHEIGRITIDPTGLPAAGVGGIEQPAWDPKTKRCYVSVPVLGADGGLMIIDPAKVHGDVQLGAFDAATNTGVLKLSDCGPNGATFGPHDNLLLGCTPANIPTNDS